MCLPCQHAPASPAAAPATASVCGGRGGDAGRASPRRHYCCTFGRPGHNCGPASRPGPDATKTPKERRQMMPLFQLLLCTSSPMATIAPAPPIMCNPNSPQPQYCPPHIKCPQCGKAACPCPGPTPGPTPGPPPAPPPAPPTPPTPPAPTPPGPPTPPPPPGTEPYCNPLHGRGCIPPATGSAFGSTGHSVDVCMPKCGPAPAFACPPSSSGKGKPKCTISPSGKYPPVYCTLGCSSNGDCPTLGGAPGQTAECWQHPQLGRICVWPGSSNQSYAH
jgi:hypothetical protein